ncbi:MAG: DUF1648 domain-containing protein [Halorhabdus sp.]
MRFQRQIDATAIGLVTIVTVAGLVLWSRLPAELVIHWSGGQPDTVVSKPIALAIPITLTIGAIAFIRLAPPSLTSTPGGPNLSVLFVGGVIAWIQVITIVWNLGYHFDVWLAMLPILLAGAALVVYATRF